MKHYLISMCPPEGDPLPPEVLDPITRDLEAVRAEMRAAGVWVFSGGLGRPGTTTVRRPKGGHVRRPGTEGGEHLAGFTIVRAPDLDAALEWGRKMAMAVRLLPIEVRPLRGEA